MTITTKLMYLEQNYLVQLVQHTVLHQMIPNNTMKSKN